MNKNKAIVTGCPGQDASYLCEYLLDMGYEVYGVSRRSTRENDNMDKCIPNKNYKAVTMDICDASGVIEMVRAIKPDEYYNLAAMSHVGQSFKEPLSTLMTNGYAVTIALEAIRHHSPDTKFYQASTSELFGKIENGKQDENTPFCPRSPYAAAKLYAHNMVKLYRESYGMFACCGILFNHESPRRGKNFVTRKITDGVARIKKGLQDNLVMGNIDAIRDWGHSCDFVRGMYLMLQQKTPDDYVLATGETASVRDAIKYVCSLADLDFDNVYEINEEFMRPAEVPYLCGDSSKAQKILGWIPVYNWKILLSEMYKSDVNLN
jgi:GDPmannose 4,6-dehydratase